MRNSFFALALVVVAFPTGAAAVPELNPELQALAAEFFQWRRVQQPATLDDVNRVERPDGWVPDFSPQALKQYRADIRLFQKHLQGLERTGWNTADEVDALLLNSAIERVRWELDALRLPHRNPNFWVDQTLGSLFEQLVLSTPMEAARVENILVRMEAIPTTVEHARISLTSAVRPFADIALLALEDVGSKLHEISTALKTTIPEEHFERLDAACVAAAEALEGFAAWLESKRDSMSTRFSPGRAVYLWFLKNVALNPYSPEELLQQGRQAWQRAVTFETLEKNRNSELPESELFKSVEAQIEQSAVDELAIRALLEERNIMTVPEWLQHYINQPVPDWVKPIAHMGVTDDLTSETRLSEDAVSYIRPPGWDLPYFKLASAQDPRPLIVHEGIPGHYFQLAWSWANPDPIRRRYFDSGANEGIGFYVEEMMLQAGLFDDRPRTREIIYNFMRLRALRVEVDVRLAIGDFTIEEAGQYLAETVPMDEATAIDEAGFFAFNPGQAITYQIGKLQIIKFLSDAKIQLGNEFNLREFHDYLMLNGNVPIALLRYEYLGLDDEFQRLRDQGPR